MDVEDDSPYSEIPAPRDQIAEKPERLSKPQAKSGPPTLSEWQDFFGRVVIKTLVNAYLTAVLGDILDELSPQDAQFITLSAEDIRNIAAPIATLSDSSSFMKKHGRKVIAFGDSYESILTLAIWMRRVRKIAKKHNPNPTQKQPRRQRRQQPQRPAPQQTNGVDPNANVSAGYSGAESSGVEQPILGVWNPGSG